MTHPSTLWVIDARMLVDQARAVTSYENAMLSTVNAVLQEFGATPQTPRKIRDWIASVKKQQGKAVPDVDDIIRYGEQYRRFCIDGYARERITEKIEPHLHRNMATASTRRQRRFLRRVSHYQRLHFGMTENRDWFRIIVPNEATYRNITATIGQVGLAYTIARDCVIPRKLTFGNYDRVILLSERKDFLKGSVQESEVARFVVGLPGNAEMAFNVAPVPNLDTLAKGMRLTVERPKADVAAAGNIVRFPACPKTAKQALKDRAALG